MQAGLAALQRTHEVYRLAREKVEAREKARGDEVGAADGVYVTPAPGDGESARAVAERELSESLRLARGAHAGQAVAGRRAAEEREQLQAALREAREVAAQRAAYSREELLQERQRRAKLETERQAEAATSEVARLTAEQRLQTQAASAKRETATLEAMLIDAQARIESLELELHAQSAGLADARMALTEAYEALRREQAALQEERGRYATLSAAMAEAEAEAGAALQAAEAAAARPAAGVVLRAEEATAGGAREAGDAAVVREVVAAAQTEADVIPPATPATPALRQRSPRDGDAPKKAGGGAAAQLPGFAPGAPPAAAMAPPAAPPRSVLTSSFSLLSAGLSSAASDGTCLLVFGGGGGASKTGVPNALVVTRLTSSLEMSLVGEHRTALAPVQSLAVSGGGQVLVALQGPDVVVYNDVSRPATQPEGASWDTIATVDKKRPAPSPLYSAPDVILRGPPADPDADGIRKPRNPEVYSVALSPCGSMVAIGVDDGTLILLRRTAAAGVSGFGAAGGSAVAHEAGGAAGGGPAAGCTWTGAGGWVESFRAKQHARDLKSLAFSHDGACVATAADDAHCLIWPTAAAAVAPTPAAVPQPRFVLHNLVTPVPTRRGKPLPRTAAWRCIAMGPPPAEPGAHAAGGLLYGALNHAAGVGWLARVGVAAGGTAARMLAHVKVTPHRLTSVALSADGVIVAAGTNEGEVVLLQASSLQRLLKLQEHQMYVSVLLLTPPDAAGCYAAISCSTNDAKVTRIRKEQLAPPALSGKALWAGVLALLVLLLAALLAR